MANYVLKVTFAKEAGWGFFRGSDKSNLIKALGNSGVQYDDLQFNERDGNIALLIFNLTADTKPDAHMQASNIFDDLAQKILVEKVEIRDFSCELAK